MKLSFQNLTQTFPDYGTTITFIAYIGLFVFQGILMKSSQTSENTYDYSTIAAVLVTELVKLLTSICWYLKDSSISDFTIDFKSNKKLLILYLIPSLLYCGYNNLTYINLRNFDPTTYNLLLQFRVVITGLIYQSIFRQKLTKWQWFSLIVLTTGCIIKNLGTKGSVYSNTLTADYFLRNLFLLLFQLSCSCIAGVFNEYLLKITGAQLNIGMHNIFMYIDSIICNIGALIYFDGSNSLDTNYPSLESFVSLLRPTVIIVIINNAACGIVTSIFLRKLNSILKTFASAIELILIACLCWILFSIPIDFYTTISIGIIFYAIYLQFKYPIKLDLSAHRHKLSSLETQQSTDSKNINYMELKNDQDEEEYQIRKGNNTIQNV